MADIVRVMTDKKNYEDIAKAIRYKKGTTDFYYPEDMAAQIRSISSSHDVASIFNHGGFQGLNPSYIILQGNNGGSPFFRYNDTTTKDYLIAPGGTGWSNNTTIMFYNPYLKNTEYTKLYLDVEVTEGRGGQYQHLYFGVVDPGPVSASLNAMQSLYLTVNGSDAMMQNYTYYYPSVLIEWSNSYNAIGNVPYYLMPRHTFCFNIPTTVEFNFCPFLYVGFETTIIHSMWLEP